MKIQRDIFPQKAATESAKVDFALPVIDQRGRIKTTATFTAGTDFTIGAGAAGTSVTVTLPVAPILGTFGRTANKTTSSFTWGGAAATTFTGEVSFIADTANQGGDTTTLTNGQYMVDYEAGIIYGKKADNGTTGTCAYTFHTAAANTQVSPTRAPVRANVLVTDAATALLATADAMRRGVAITNGSTNPIWVGPAGVTAGTTGLLAASASAVFDNYGGVLYGICTAGLTSNVEVFTW